jgi:ribonuclease HI
VLASAPASGDGRLGRRTYDPFAGTADDIASWRRAERVVLDATLLLAGGRRGLDAFVAELLQLAPPAGLPSLPPARTIPRSVSKLVGYVPDDAMEAVRDAVFATGAGTIGGYDRCSWSTRGTGTFRGGEGTDPAVGTRGEFERVDEARMEVVVQSHLIDAACRAFVAAHPYEEPAFDVVPLAIPAQVGFGRAGRLDSGGGAAAWSALGDLDPNLTAHGRVDKVAAGTACIVHAGPLRDIIDSVIAADDLGLVVIAAATDAELDLLDELGIAALVLDPARVFAAHAASIAGALTRALEIPVTVHGGLHFPDAPTAASPTPAASIFDTPTPTGTGDYATGAWRLHFDGGSRGNPGPAAYGWVLYDPDGNEHESDGVRIGSTTNNVAEWTGLLKGLESALARGVRTIQVRGDSELVVKQATGVYKVKNANLKPLAEQVSILLRQFDGFDVKHVYRDANARADAVANEAMDGLR